MFRSHQAAWFLGCATVEAFGMAFLPWPGGRPFFWRFSSYLVGLAAFALLLSLTAHGVASLWNRLLGARPFQGLSTQGRFSRRVIKDGWQIYLFLMAQGAFGVLLTVAVLGAVHMIR